MAGPTDPVRVHGQTTDGKIIPGHITNDGAWDVYLQDQTTPIRSFWMKRLLNLVALAAPVAVGARQATFAPGHGFLVGEHIADIENGEPWQGEVLAVVGNLITVDTPSGFRYSTAAAAARTTIDMNINASAAPVIYNINPIQEANWDIVYMVISIEGTGGMDTGTFGDQARLANGVTIRKALDSEFRNLLTAHSNGDWETLGGWSTYHTRAPGGTNGFVCRFQFAGQGNFGAAVRLTGELTQEWQAVLYDDLSGLDLFRIGIQLHEVLD